jgi:hypothetical protein
MHVNVIDVFGMMFYIGSCSFNIGACKAFIMGDTGERVSLKH